MKVIVGIGVPGCGKTTYLKPLASKLGLAYINPDDIREELTGDASDHSREIAVWALVQERLAQALRQNGAVIDATYTKIKERRALVTFCKQHGAREVEAYWFDAPVEICMERNRKRQRVVPDAAIRQMHNRLRLNPPTTDEGFTKITVFQNDTAPER